MMRLIVLFLIILLAPVTTFAQKDPSSIKPNQFIKQTPVGTSWKLDCSQKRSGRFCELSIKADLDNQHEGSISISVQRLGASREPSMTVRLPHGIFLPAGLKVVIDNLRIKNSSIQTCDKEACYSGVALNHQDIETLISGATLRLIFQKLSKEEIKITLTLNGFHDGYKKL